MSLIHLKVAAKHSKVFLSATLQNSWKEYGSKKSRLANLLCKDVSKLIYI